MDPVETILMLLVGVAVLVTVAHRLGIAYPVVLVLGGLVLGFVPGLPTVQVPPGIVFLVFIPPLVYVAAVQTPWREFRANLRPIGLLAIGLVLVTIVAVAAVAHAVVGLGWVAAFVLAAVVAPTDVVAVTALGDRIRLPRRVMTILEGEGLLNDVTALIAYRAAVTAAVVGTFSLGRMLLELPWAALAGAGIGLAIGWLAVRLRRQLNDPPVEITVSLLTPYAAYLPAEWVGASGVLAVAAAGVYVGWRGPAAFPADSRTLGLDFWRMIEFILNGLGFILVGLSLRPVYAELTGRPLRALLAEAGVVILTVVGVRLAWVFPVAALARRLDPASKPPWKEVVVVGWAGVRGVDSLAAALAIPLAAAGGAPFPDRGPIVFLSFGVILATLIGQGLTLPLLIAWLRFPGDSSATHEESVARLAAARAALAQLDKLRGQAGMTPLAHRWLQDLYEARAQDARRHLHAETGGDGALEEVQRLRLELLRAERQAILALRQRGEISDEALNEVQRDLDLEELRLQPNPD